MLVDQAKEQHPGSAIIEAIEPFQQTGRDGSGQFAVGVQIGTARVTLKQLYTLIPD